MIQRKLIPLISVFILFLTGCGILSSSLVPHTGLIKEREFYDNYVSAAEAMEMIATNDMSYAKYVDLPASDTFEVLTDRRGNVTGFKCSDYIYFGSAWGEKQFARLTSGIADLYLSTGEGTLQELQNMIFTDMAPIWEHPYWEHDIETHGLHLTSTLDEQEDGSIITFEVVYDQ